MSARAITRDRIAGSQSPGWTTSVFDRVTSGFAGIARQMRLRRDREHLHAMPDYILDDIGISRLDIDRAVELGRAGLRGDGNGAMTRRTYGE